VPRRHHLNGDIIHSVKTSRIRPGLHEALPASVSLISWRRRRKPLPGAEIVLTGVNSFGVGGRASNSSLLLAECW
jgi:hypothetical protein